MTAVATSLATSPSQQHPQSHWGYGERPLVVDDEAPFAPIPETPSQDLLSEVSLQECYRRSCATLGIKANAHILAQLPDTTEGRPHWALQILDGTGAYLGSKGVAALIPIIAASPRLTHILLPRIGMQVGAAKALIDALSIHPGVTTIQLQQNHLGTAVGQLILKLVQNHQRIHTIGLDETLIIPQLKRRIDACLERNHAIKDQFALPLIPLTADDYERMAAEKVREAEERARHIRAETLRKEIADRVPTWAVAVISELRVALIRHRRNVANVLSLFKPNAPAARTSSNTSSSSSTAAARASIPCSIDNFQRGLKILGITAPQLLEKNSATAVQNCRDFAQLFAAYDSHDDSIRAGDLVAALRVHAAVIVGDVEQQRWVPLRAASVVETDDTASSSTAAATQRALDALYDARANVASSLEAMDRDQLFTARVSEIANGLASLVGDATAVRAVLVHYLTAAERDVSDESAVAAGLVVQTASTSSSSHDGTTNVSILVKPELDQQIRYHPLLDAFGLELLRNDSTEGEDDNDDAMVQLIAEQKRLEGATRSDLRRIFPLL
ncbi:Hypothetical protein, putative [Bodo saltans]|uniref:Leucine-rich repeat protein n=1 Tax=Bodo saltans TaxID=75058 RepID=A0A0S4JEC0_BODSA|nr:Hypothetical protein, putative [Bodo saltans]|eukprot:CUG88321.1 Hypothetical protein, putative [Bodo saltans]